MANVILTQSGAVIGPAYPEPEEPVMAESTEVWPCFYYSPTCLEGKVFASQAEVTAARSEGPWTRSKTEAEEAAAKPKTPTVPAPDEEEEAPTRRSHR
jgi:hypothetical protein